MPKLRDLDLDCDDKVTALVFGHRSLMRQRRRRMCGTLAVGLHSVSTEAVSSLKCNAEVIGDMRRVVLVGRQLPPSVNAIECMAFTSGGKRNAVPSTVKAKPFGRGLRPRP